MANKKQEELQLQTKEKKYNLKNDVIFQTFFSRKGNEEFLIDFLNALLNKDIKSIEVREEVNLERLSKEEKGGRLDLQAKLKDGTIISIEMQLRNEYNIEERTTLYSGKVLKWYFIELPKFRKQNPDMNEKINQWLAFIDDYNKEMIKVAEEKNDKLKKARIEMNYLTGDAEVRRLAELREKWEMDRISAINHAARKAEERRKKRTEK